VPFELIAGRISLDFVATVSERGTTDLDHLSTPADLVDWIEVADLTDRRLSATTADLEEARKLRESLFAVVTSWTQQSSPPERHRKIVNASAAMAPPTLVLTKDGQVSRDGNVSSVLAALARDALDLADSPDRELVRWCADPNCTRPFVDQSRGRRRRWCGMRGCGDRAKAAAYRRRRRQHPSTNTAGPGTGQL
jgi:predicted RNA-binding Zn ribbon-like protein